MAKSRVPDAVEQEDVEPVAGIVVDEPAEPEAAPAREVGSKVRTEVRADGSIARFESETAQLHLQREVGS